MIVKTIITMYFSLIGALLSSFFLINKEYIQPNVKIIELIILIISTISLYIVANKSKKNNSSFNPWQYFFYALLSASIANIIWHIQQINFYNNNMFPTIADLIKLFFYFFIALGLFHIYRPLVSKITFIKTSLDNTVIMVSASLFIYLVFHIDFETALALNGWRYLLLSVLYPLLNVFLFTFLMLASLADEKKYLFSILPFWTAILINTIADLLLLYDLTSNIHSFNTVIHYLRSINYLLISLSGIIYLNKSLNYNLKILPQNTNKTIRSVIPYLSMYIILLYLGLQVSFNTYHINTLQATVYALTISSTVVVLKQMITIHENRILASTDHLTGLLNYRALFHKLEKDLTPNEIYTICWLDLDGFKIYNDTFGHLAGDELLTKISNFIKNNIRSKDIAFRYGGDEFIILINDNKFIAHQVAERIRQQFKMISDNKLTLSVGIVEINHDIPIYDNLNRADQAMYIAKKFGKDKSIIMDLAI